MADDKLNILLCCGAGISSGFLASSARKAAKKAKLNVSVEARSHTDVANYMGSIDILMMGPHYRAELQDYVEMGKPHGVPVVIIPEDIYSTLDGTRLIELAQKTLADFRANA